MRVRFALGPGFGGDHQLVEVQPSAVLSVEGTQGFIETCQKKRAVSDPLAVLEGELAGGGCCAVGFFAYEFAAALDPTLAVCPKPGPLPRMWWALIDTGHWVKRPTGAWRVGQRPRVSLNCHEFYRGVETIRDAIGRGDVYQVNLTRRWQVGFQGDPAALYAALTGEHPPRFSCFLEDREQGWAVVGLSPELFLQKDGEVVESCSVKGTWWEGVPGGIGEKEHAELAMIVDLVRHDLGQVCQPGSVEVVSPSRPLRTRDVVHREAVVRGRVRSWVTLRDLLRATFPGGSVTGAPKLAACALIAHLEPVPRSVYCGAYGVLYSPSRFTLAMPIRTGYVTAGKLFFHSGGGIVWDSQPQQEERETREKVRSWLKLLEVEG